MDSKHTVGSRDMNVENAPGDTWALKVAGTWVVLVGCGLVA